MNCGTVQNFYFVILFWDYTELPEVIQHGLGYKAEKTHQLGILKGGSWRLWSDLEISEEVTDTSSSEFKGFRQECPFEPSDKLTCISRQLC